MAKYTEDDLREDLKTKEYEAGFYTDIEYEDFPVGLNEEIVRMISAKKEEPSWMTDWRLESFRIWQKMEEPDWANIKYEKPDFQAINIMLLQRKNQNYKFRRSRSRIIENFCKIRNQYRRAKTFSWCCGGYCNGFGFSENHFPRNFERKRNYFLLYF
jgi:hypothetical protein